MPSFSVYGHIGVDLISKLLGTEERAAVLGRENRMNQQVREGLAHTYITAQNGVLFIQKRPPFQGESGTAGLPRAKAPGLFCGPPSGGGKFRWRRYVDAYRRRPGGKNGQLATAQGVAMVGEASSLCFFGRRQSEDASPTPPSRRPILIATKDMLISGTGH